MNTGFIDSFISGFLERIFVFIILGVVALVIGLVPAVIFFWRFKRNMPTAERMAQLIAMIREWKVEGKDYSERLDLLRKQGLRKDVAEIILAKADKGNTAR